MPSRKAPAEARRVVTVKRAEPVLAPPVAAWRESERVPDPAVRVLDKRFQKYYLYHACVMRHAHGYLWAEGPVWFGDGRYLIWTDIPNDRIMRWDEPTGAVSVFRQPSNHANGQTRDRQGRLITCEHATRRVTRTEYDGSITVLIDGFDGKRLNAPNDVVVKSDNSIWFTDPHGGLRNDFLGVTGEPELPKRVYRLDPATGKASVVVEGMSFPNGLCFSPDETRLYIVESRADPDKIHLFDVIKDGTALGKSRVFADAGADGRPDGMRCDEDGNLWAGWGQGPGLDGVAVFAPDGDMIAHILLPERCANLCFGGPKRNRLFMAAYSSVYSLYTNTRGVAGG